MRQRAHGGEAMPTTLTAVVDEAASDMKAGEETSARAPAWDGKITLDRLRADIRKFAQDRGGFRREGPSVRYALFVRRAHATLFSLL